ncbi:MAG: hypothetical protein CML16_15660 [Pusillimonas sp.]|nr:hypothetical protein [Pusillimonas sp.]MBC42507.1 hypothetical protein [Pusillimonas sp.]HCP78296.1 hypothetical protein [Pusillimonas sp.]
MSQAMHRLSGQYPRFGSRRIRVFLGREGIQIGKERRSRLWNQAGCKCPQSASDAVWLVASLVRVNPTVGTTFGVITSCAAPVPMVKRTNI